MTNTLLKHILTVAWVHVSLLQTHSVGEEAECIDTTDKLNSHITDYMLTNLSILTTPRVITLHILLSNDGSLLYRCIPRDYLPDAVTESLINRLKPYSKHIQLLTSSEAWCLSRRDTVLLLYCVLVILDLLSSGFIWGYRGYRPFRGRVNEYRGYRLLQQGWKHELTWASPISRAPSPACGGSLTPHDFSNVDDLSFRLCSLPLVVA